MKARQLSLIALLATLFMISCKSDPLPGNDFHVANDTVIIHGEETQFIDIEYTGFQECSFQVKYCPTWLWASAQWYGRIRPGETARYYIGVSRDLCSDGISGCALKGHLTIGNSNDYVTVTVIYVPEAHQAYHVPECVYHPVGLNSFGFAINNYSDRTLSYAISNGLGNVQLPSPSGQIAPFGQAVVQVQCSDHQQGDEATLNVTVDGDSHLTRLIATQHAKIETAVVDADYNKQTDVLVCALGTPNLAVYDATSQTLREIHLPDYPNCVSISQDGTKAVVGHKKSISYIDLENNMVICNRAVRCDVFDIVLGPNQWAYFTPIEEQWDDIHYLDLSQPYSTEKTRGSIHGCTHITLHSSGKSLYMPINLSPESIEKYDIQEIDPDYVHEMRFDEGHYVEGMLWCSDNGDRLFTRGLSVLRTSDNMEEDLDVIGDIVLDGSIVFHEDDEWRWNKLTWLDYNTVSQRIYLIPRNENDFLYSNAICEKKYIYMNDGSSLQPLGKIGVEDMLMTDDKGLMLPVSSLPRYVFSNSDGSKIIVISKPFAPWIYNHWEIQSINVE